MPTTTVGAVAQILDLMYPDFAVSRDGTEDRALGSFPRITLREAVSRVRLPASARHLPRIQELIQIDIWQKREDGFAVEDLTMRPRIERALDDQGPIDIGPGGVVLRMMADGGASHDYDPTTNVIHDAITVRVNVQLRTPSQLLAALSA